MTYDSFRSLSYFESPLGYFIAQIRIPQPFAITPFDVSQMAMLMLSFFPLPFEFETLEIKNSGNDPHY